MRSALLGLVLLFTMAHGAHAECVDLNVAPVERLVTIAHIDEARAEAIIAGRPWPGVRALTQLRGIGAGRLGDILDQSVACVGVYAPAGQRERIEGQATILDADTIVVEGVRIRLIGIDAPEGNQLCQADGHDWPCGQVATAAVYEIVGGRAVSCEVYGYDRFDRALAVCYLDGHNLNATIVREGWALAWYPARGAILGPRFDDAEREAERHRRGIWRGEFVEPWVWRRR